MAEKNQTKRKRPAQKASPASSAKARRLKAKSPTGQKTSPSPSAGQLAIEKRIAAQKQVKWVIIQCVVSVVVCIALFFLGLGAITSKKEEVFISIDEQNRVKPLTPIYEPKHSNVFVGDWLNKCLVKTFDFSYTNYQKNLSEAVDTCYSDEGEESLEKALINTGNLQAVTDKRLYASIAMDYTPTVVRQMTPTTSSEPYRWILTSKGVVTLTSQTSRDTTKVDVTAVVSRSSFEDKTNGLSIDRIIIE